LRTADGTCHALAYRRMPFPYGIQPQDRTRHADDDAGGRSLGPGRLRLFRGVVVRVCASPRLHPHRLGNSYRRGCDIGIRLWAELGVEEVAGSAASCECASDRGAAVEAAVPVRVYRRVLAPAV